MDAVQIIPPAGAAPVFVAAADVTAADTTVAARLEAGAHTAACAMVFRAAELRTSPSRARSEVRRVAPSAMLRLFP